MRITPVLVLEELLRLRATASTATAWFKTKKHNEDLCPIGERQLNAVMDCFHKFFSIGYDIQGPGDQGTDLVLRYLPAGDAEHEFVAIQLKSYDDINKKDYLRNLKAQESDARGRFRDQLSRYYILICTDSKEHTGQIRAIKNAFATTANVSVVDPTFALTFFRMTAREIFSAVQAEVRGGDIVFKQARRIAADLSPTQFALMLVLISSALNDRVPTMDELFSNSFVRHAYAAVPELPHRNDYFRNNDSTRKVAKNIQERFAKDIDNLTGEYIQSHATQGWVLDLDALKPLSLLLLDAELRFDLRGDELLEHVYELFKSEWPLGNSRTSA